MTYTIFATKYSDQQMNTIYRFIVILLVSYTGFSLSAQNNNQQVTFTNEQGDDIFYHTIERGQTVTAIATMYGVSVDDIFRLNSGSEQGIKAGAILQIPQRDVAVSPIQTEDDNFNYIYHTIQPKETLYSLSIKYNVPGTEIVRANPGLTVETLRYGYTIRIPATRIEDLPKTEIKKVQKEIEYTVQRRETLYRISRKFNISTAELIRLNPNIEKGLKAGMVIKIPIETEIAVTEEIIMPQEGEINALLTEPKQIERINSIHAAILLPFSTKNASDASLYTEYYEGILMAVDSLQNIGYSLNLFVRDIGDGTERIKHILQEKEMQEVNLIIGAVENDQIKLLADFAQERNIKYVIPFTSRNDDVLSNAQIFQVNTPHSYIYDKAAQAGCNIFADDNIIIVHIADNMEKSEFVNAFKTEMQHRSIPFIELKHNEKTFTEDIKKVFDPNRRNIVLPTSDSLEALKKIKTILRTLAETTTEQHPPYNISLFGYPKWQTYTHVALEDFYALNTYIYSSFFANNLDPNVQHFYTGYRNWFSKNPINTTPKYGIFGFDTAMFFFKAMRSYGSNFENNLEHIDYKSVQTGFNFERVNNWGGFINTHIFIVQYRSDYTIVRNEIH